MFGVDISKHNNLKEKDFTILKNSGVEFVIIRAGYGRLKTQEDPCFKNYYKWAKSAGLKVGCYWYSYAMSEKEIKQEAQVFYSVIKDFIFEMPVYLDFEEPNQFKLSKVTINNMIRTFLDYMESRGYWVGLYMSRYYLNTYVDENTIRNRYAIWVAEYGKKTSYKNYGIWQYTDKGKFKGINCNFDLNNCIINYPKLIKAKRLNGYQFYKSNEVLVKQILDGYWGNGEIRKQLLKDAGYNYNGVQALVNMEVKKNAKG